jgi:hypothetical protein
VKITSSLSGRATVISRDKEVPIVLQLIFPLMIIGIANPINLAMASIEAAHGFQLKV